MEPPREAAAACSLCRSDRPRAGKGQMRLRWGAKSGEAPLTPAPLPVGARGRPRCPLPWKRAAAYSLSPLGRGLGVEGAFVCQPPLTQTRTMLCLMPTLNLTTNIIRLAGRFKLFNAL